GGDDARAGIDAEEWLAKAMRETCDGFAIGGNAKDAATIATDGRAGLAGLGDDEAAVGRKLHAAGEFARLSGLGPAIAKEFVAIRLAVAVGVENAPDAVAVVDKDFIFANREAQGFVQARGKTPPANVFQI